MNRSQSWLLVPYSLVHDCLLICRMLASMASTQRHVQTVGINLYRSQRPSCTPKTLTPSVAPSNDGCNTLAQGSQQKTKEH